MTLALLGIIVLVLETLRLAGVLGSANVLPPAIAIAFPVFWLIFFLWKASPSERPAVIVGASTFFLLLNRTALDLGQLTVPLVYFGSLYLVYFGCTRGVRSSGTFRMHGKWLLLSVLMVLAIMVLIIAAPSLP